MGKDTLKILGASNHTEAVREENDFYSTDPDCVKDLLAVETFNHDLLEPCCGTGNISKALEEAGYNVTSTDLIDRGYGIGGIDFFKHYQVIDTDVVTNPPYGLATEFMEHCLNHTVGNHKIALFLKLQTLEGAARFTKVFNQKHLKKVYIYSKRVACYKGDERYQRNNDGTLKLDKAGNPLKIQSAVCYAWFIFDTSYVGLPVLDWINTPDDAEY